MILDWGATSYVRKDSVVQLTNPMNTVPYLQILTKIESEKKIIQDKEDKIRFDLEILKIEKNNVVELKSNVFKELLGNFHRKNETSELSLPLTLKNIGIYKHICMHIIHMYVCIYSYM
jgi:hypothetical protein